MGMGDGDREGLSGTLTRGQQPELPRGTSMNRDLWESRMTVLGVRMLFGLLARLGISHHVSVDDRHLTADT